jgi:ABC-type transport system involved in Fe-S cluster assembly fused permease/ATPase subunit
MPAALLRLTAERTGTAIAHRRSIIQKADKILVIKGGRVIDRADLFSLLVQRVMYHDHHNS